MVIPVRIWDYAFRVAFAAVVALYVAFWLQLGGASSAAVTVAILAQPTRGAALAKAVNRIAATLIGATMSVVIAGLFPGDRIGMLGAFVCWISICVFVASYLRGYQAYAAVLSGYTVAIITLVNIDTPQNVFTTMTDRMAAITIGILCVTLINDTFGSPSVWRALDCRMRDVWRDVRIFARDVLNGNEGNTGRAGALLAQISGLRDQVDIVAHDMADGRRRAAGGGRQERHARARRDGPAGSAPEVACAWRAPGRRRQGTMSFRSRRPSLRGIYIPDKTARHRVVPSRYCCRRNLADSTGHSLGAIEDPARRRTALPALGA